MKHKWSDLSGKQRVALAVVSALGVGMTAAAVKSAHKGGSEGEEGGKKIRSLARFLCPLTYLKRRKKADPETETDVA